MSETVLYNFTGTAGGSNPQTLVQYGSTAYGIAQLSGANSTGTIFSISLNSPNTFNKLYDFSSNLALGCYPISIVINSTGTILYGVAAAGGSNSSGTIFSFLTSPPYTYTKIYDLSNNNQQLNTPNQLLLSGSTLYGYTTGSSTTQTGSLFSININGTGYSQLYSPVFVFTNSNRIVGLAISGSTLYFSTSYNSTLYGSIYSIPAGGGSATTLWTNLSANAVPTNLTVSGSTIYFSTHTGSAPPVSYTNWQICSISTTGTGFQQLTSLSTAQPDGISSIVLSGNTLYAASFFGGTGTNGGLYSTSTSVSPSPTLLYSFLGQPTDGFAPYISFLYNSKLYGVTILGGTSNIGTIFSFGPKQYNFVPITSDYYNIFTNGQMSVGNNTPGVRYTNRAITMDVAGNINTQGSFNSYSSSCFQLPADSSANRPTLSGSTYKGMIRYNTDINLIEFYNGVSWNYLIPGTPTLTITPSGGSPTNYTYLFGTANTLNTSGYYTVLPGANMTLKIQMWGAGGGGGIGGANPCYGGAGGYVEGLVTLVGGTTYVFLIGQGGARATAYTPNTGTIGSAAFPDGGQAGNNTGSGLSNPASSAGPYPNDGTNDGYGPASGGGSTRFGLYNQGSVTITNSAANYNNSLANYYLISGGGGGGTDYTTSATTNLTGVITPGGWGAGGGPSGGAGTAGAGVAWYGYGNFQGTPYCEATTSPGGGGSSSGGTGGTNGRLGPGTAGAKYQGGNSTGGGGGGGYYGGGGAAGYYAVGGGGSGYINTSVITNYLSQTATTGVTTNYVSPTGSTTKPTSPFTGNPSGNGGTVYGGTVKAGDSFTSSTFNYINGSDGAIVFTFQ